MLFMHSMIMPGNHALGLKVSPTSFPSFSQMSASPRNPGLNQPKSGSQNTIESGLGDGSRECLDGNAASG